MTQVKVHNEGQCMQTAGLTQHNTFKLANPSSWGLPIKSGNFYVLVIELRHHRGNDCSAISFGRPTHGVLLNSWVCMNLWPVWGRRFSDTALIPLQTAMHSCFLKIPPETPNTPPSPLSPNPLPLFRSLTL